MKSCSNCVYNTEKGCIALTKRIKTNCFAWANEEIVKQRLRDIKNYRNGGSKGYLYGSNTIEGNLEKLLEV